MNMSFKKLHSSDFQALSRWLTMPHVSRWYGQGQQWTAQAVEDKYASYVHGYKVENGQHRSITAYIIYLDNRPIGYIQLYNAYDFSREGYQLEGLPISLAALDFFIGEPSVLGKGIGTVVIKRFLHEHIWPAYEYCIVDPEQDNGVAIKTFTNAGFEIVKTFDHPPVVLMLATKKDANEK